MSEHIASAISACSSANNAESSRRAYEVILDAVGNNHAGTYGPSVLPLIDALAEILTQPKPWAQHAALVAMIDLYGSFEPAASVSGQLCSELRNRVATLEPVVSSIATQTSVASESAQDLLELLHGAA